MNAEAEYVHPYDYLNDQLRDEYKKHDAHGFAGNKLLPLPRTHNSIFHGTSHKNNNFRPPDDFLIKLKHRLSHKLYLL